MPLDSAGKKSELEDMVVKLQNDTQGKNKKNKQTNKKMDRALMSCGTILAGLIRV